MSYHHSVNRGLLINEIHTHTYTCIFLFHSLKEKQLMIKNDKATFFMKQLRVLEINMLSFLKVLMSSEDFFFFANVGCV